MNCLQNSRNWEFLLSDCGSVQALMLGRATSMVALALSVTLSMLLSRFPLQSFNYLSSL